MSDLQRVLKRAEDAAASDRINLRDAVASFGRPAIERVEAWLSQPRLAFFASRVLERIAADHREPAVGALRRGLASAAEPARAEVEAALRRLSADGQGLAPRARAEQRQPRTWPSRQLGHPYGLVSAYRVLNTSHHNNALDDSYMLGEHRAAAFFSPSKEKIETLAPGDVVFLYRNGAGIVAIGQVVDDLKRRAYHGRPEHADEEFYRTLDPFQHVGPPASAAEIKDVVGKHFSFRGTMFTVKQQSGERLLLHLTGGLR